MNRTQEVFDRSAHVYDKDRSRLIPGCAAFYQWTLDLIPAGARSILELGAGSGLLSILLRERFPDAHLHLVDFSAPMLELAKQRLSSDPRVSFEQADYVKAPFPPGQDAVVSSLSIHRLADEDTRTVFAKAWSALRAGGAFINAEQVAAPTEALEARHKAVWLQQVRSAGATPEQIAAALDRMRKDRCVSVEAQLTWMRDAGFLDADC